MGKRPLHREFKVRLNEVDRWWIKIPPMILFFILSLFVLILMIIKEIVYGIARASEEYYEFVAEFVVFVFEKHFQKNGN